MKRNKVLILLIIFISVNCTQNSNFKRELIQANGMPDVDQDFSFMHFINVDEGYLFGTLSIWSDTSNEQIENSNKKNHFTEEANIYKTTDGGKNWIKIDSINNCSYSKNATYYDGSIYIYLKNSIKNYTNSLLRFKIADSSITVLKYNFERIGEIWINENKICIIYTNNDISKILVTNRDLKKIDSICIDKSFRSNILSVMNQSVVLTYYNQLYNITKNRRINFTDSLFSYITVKNNSEILILVHKNNNINILAVNIITNKLKRIGRIPGYHIVYDLQSNNKIITCFVGNMEGFFNCYDLLYSVDEGKTWKIRKLTESSYVFPSCLIDNILYIYSGGARIQKIILE